MSSDTYAKPREIITMFHLFSENRKNIKQTSPNELSLELSKNQYYRPLKYTMRHIQTSQSNLDLNTSHLGCAMKKILKHDDLGKEILNNLFMMMVVHIFGNARDYKQEHTCTGTTDISLCNYVRKSLERNYHTQIPCVFCLKQKIYNFNPKTHKLDDILRSVVQYSAHNMSKNNIWITTNSYVEMVDNIHDIINKQVMAQIHDSFDKIINKMAGQELLFDNTDFDKMVAIGDTIYSLATVDTQDLNRRFKLKALMYVIKLRAEGHKISSIKSINLISNTQIVCDLTQMSDAEIYMFADMTTQYTSNLYFKQPDNVDLDLAVNGPLEERDYTTYKICELMQLGEIHGIDMDDYGTKKQKPNKNKKAGIIQLIVDKRQIERAPFSATNFPAPTSFEFHMSAIQSLINKGTTEVDRLTQELKQAQLLTTALEQINQQLKDELDNQKRQIKQFFEKFQ